MLLLDGKPFAVGRTRFFDSLNGPEPTAKIYIRLLPGEIEIPVLAQIDTGAAWSVLERDIAEAMNLFEQTGHVVTLSTRRGTVAGRLVRAPIALLADEGISLRIDATLFVSPDWAHGNYIGYCGLLERIRFAVDPQTNAFYFGTD
jgi:hypothetical protein